MKTILIPTDFNASALNCIPDLCASTEEKELNVIFVHMFRLSDSITDMLMLSRRSREFEFVNDAFHEATRSAKSRFPQIKSLTIEFFYGSTLRMFKNFTEANDIDYILHPEFCTWEKLNKNSINPAALIEKSGIPVYTIMKKYSAPQLRQELPVLEEDRLIAV